MLFTILMYYSYTLWLCNRLVQSYSCSHTLRKERKRSYHTTTDESSLRNTIIVYCTAKPAFAIMSMWMSEYHLQKAQLVMATFCCGSDLMVAVWPDSSPFCAGDEVNLWQINGILVWLWLEIRKCLWLQFLHKTGSAVHSPFSLSSVTCVHIFNIKQWLWE